MSGMTPPARRQSRRWAKPANAPSRSYRGCGSAACWPADDDELAREMRRFVALAGGTVNIGDLAESLFYWSDRTRARWAFYYHDAGFAAPEPKSESESESAPVPVSEDRPS